MTDKNELLKSYLKVTQQMRFDKKRQSDKIWLELPHAEGEVFDLKKAQAQVSAEIEALDRLIKEIQDAIKE